MDINLSIAITWGYIYGFSKSRGKRVWNNGIFSRLRGQQAASISWLEEIDGSADDVWQKQCERKERASHRLPAGKLAIHVLEP